MEGVSEASRAGASEDNSNPQAYCPLELRFKTKSYCKSAKRGSARYGRVISETSARSAQTRHVASVIMSHFIIMGRPTVVVNSDK